MEERNSKDNSRNIFYAVVGIATLIVSVMGATFAYFTATAANNSITGNMAEISFDIDVKKVTNADNTIGMIPMSNNMMEMAISDASGKGVCVDNNGNAVCQIYKVTVVNDSTASMFLDGYVTLTGGSGTPTDVLVDDPETEDDDESEWLYSTSDQTTMRWAQVFCETEANNLVSDCTTAGKSTSRTTNDVTFTALGGTESTLGGVSVKNDGDNKTQIKLSSATGVINDVANNYNINGNPYLVIDKNYIRISDKLSTNTSYDRENDITSALVYSQYIDPNDNDATNNDGTSKGAGTNRDKVYKDAQVYYFVVWLSETGFNQTVSTDAELISYFRGTVKFISSQGSEVTATFANHARVSSTS